MKAFIFLSFSFFLCKHLSLNTKKNLIRFNLFRQIITHSLKQFSILNHFTRKLFFQIILFLERKRLHFVVTFSIPLRLISSFSSSSPSSSSLSSSPSSSLPSSYATLPSNLIVYRYFVAFLFLTKFCVNNCLLTLIIASSSSFSSSSLSFV